MKYAILLFPVAFLAFVSTAWAATDCSAAKRRAILEPATKSKSTVNLDCNITIRQGEVISKQVRIRGAEASGVRLICTGGVIGLRGKNSLHSGKDIIQIRSAKGGGNGWSRPTNVVIDGCEVNGAIRVYGLGPNGQADNVKASSRRANHTERAQNAAPSGIELRNLIVRGDGRIPVYFSPGVTNSKLINSRITGQSSSSGMYLDAESANNEIRGNTFSVRTPREILSVDGSASNVIANNLFNHSNNGGVYVYRNCGEGGAARHQKPRFNRITNNTFRYSGSSNARPTIWLSFGNTLRSVFLCPQDAGIAYGSGSDDRNFARKNTVSNNTFVNSPIAGVIRDDDKDNKVFSNRRVRQ